MGKKLLSLVLAATMLLGVTPCTNKVANATTNLTEKYTWNNVQIEGGGFIPGIIFSKVEKNALHRKMKCIDCYCSFFSLKEDVNTIILIAVVTGC